MKKDGREKREEREEEKEREEKKERERNREKREKCECDENVVPFLGRKSAKTRIEFLNQSLKRV